MTFPKRRIAFVVVPTNHGALLVNRFDYVDSHNVRYGVGSDLLEKSSFSEKEIDGVTTLLAARRGTHGDGVFVLDCGANIGVHTVHWAKFVHGWGEVLAFEPQERLFYALAGNVTLNNCFNARAVWAAVGRTSAPIVVPVPNYFQPTNFGGLELQKSDSSNFIGQTIDYDPNKGQQVQMIAIDDLALRRVDFIKIDVEKMEMDVLEGAKNTITRHKPMMLIEVIKTQKSLVEKFVLDIGYRTFEFGNNLLAVHGDDPTAPLINIQ